MKRGDKVRIKGGTEITIGEAVAPLATVTHAEGDLVVVRVALTAHLGRKEVTAVKERKHGR